MGTKKRVAVVTGGNRGIGLEVARQLGKRGLSVVLGCRDETAGLLKIVIDASNDRILGATILAVEGGELTHVLYTLMLANLPYTLLKGAVYIHPTLAEVFFALMDSVKPVD